jgi:hypothetical protein
MIKDGEHQDEGPQHFGKIKALFSEIYRSTNRPAELIIAILLPVSHPDAN